MTALVRSRALRGRLREREPLAPHTSWRVGGAADRYYEPADRDDLLAFLARLAPTEPLLWLGLGSNLLVRDGGWRGSVIALHGTLDALRREGDTTLYAEAGVHCARLAKFAERARLAGLGFMAGIPGTVGGALAMNAGAWGGETWPAVLAAEAAYRDGSSAWLQPSAFTIGYRQVVPPANFAGFLGARFAVTPDDGSHAHATRESLVRRKATQPVGRPSAGSTFRNPPGDHAARLIESCGLKGARAGGAAVSAQHANFIITEPGATAADVETLIERIRSTVLQRTGVELVAEVRIVGERR
ncbi:MAG: UDP-N-acetylmuramate dehydrogenase [Gammaproteobacteria bacterium]|nr:UDP-N-acetylmuramate dehydrogenase [Gammaproteobacteria bacterium]